MKQWLREIREKSKLTHKQIASNVGISRASYTNIESGHRRPSPEVAKKIAQFLNFEKSGLDWTKFFDEENPRVS